MEIEAKTLYGPRANQYATNAFPRSSIAPEKEPPLTMGQRVQWNEAFERAKITVFTNKTSMKIYLYYYIIYTLLTQTFTPTTLYSLNRNPSP